MPLDRLTKLDPLQLGRFAILARLGGGGMGNVYLAEADDGTPAAVKVIRAELAQDTQFRARFRREVEAGRRVQNRCIARYLDADTFAASPWLATEFVPGPTLHHEVFANGPVIGPRVIGLGTGLADALVAIHAAGLVHRDLKPANILLAPDAPKVIDFGISLAADATVLTTTGTLVGSPAYMSPEQARGIRDVGPAADVFSWASCMTFASRRQPPFGEGEAAGLLYKVVHDEPDLTGLAPALLPFVQAALDKEPENRPTALELVAGLTAVLDGTPAGTLVAPAVGGGVSRVLAPVTAANAGRVLVATWMPDHTAVEQAEQTLAEARELRSSLPPRAEERSRRDRVRAKRAVFVSMLIALVALLVVGIATVRPGQVDEARPANSGAGADPEPSSSTSGPAGGNLGAASSVAPATTTAPAGQAQAGAGSPAATGNTAPPPSAPAGTTATSVGAAPTAPTGSVPRPSVTSSSTCSAQLLITPPTAATDQLPTYDASGSQSTYRIRVSASAGGTLALVRRGGGGAAWTVTLGGASPADVGPFAMVLGGSGPPGATAHTEARGQILDLQLQPSGRPALACGTFRGPPL